MPYLKRFFGGEALKLPLERAGLSDEAVATHIAHMYHHRVFRDTKQRTAEPSGTGENAARAAVGLPPLVREEAAVAETVSDEECEVWGPNGICLQTKAEAEAWRKRRFEKVQIEGTRGLGHR